MTITFDASLSGGGATLQETWNDEITDYIIAEWTEQDHQNLHAARGDPKHQAEWETYALLMAIRTWCKRLAQFQGKLWIVGDAKGILQDVIARRARNPQINLLVAEIQLELADSPHDITAVHIWSQQNRICDELSRMCEGRQEPPEVSAAYRWQPVMRPFPIFNDGSNWQME